MKNSLHILKDLRELLSDPNRWIQGMAAQDANGERCFGARSEAVKWCMIGGISKVSFDPGTGFTSDARAMAQEALETVIGNGPNCITRFNDHHSHTEVMAKIDEAIEWERNRKRRSGSVEAD